MPQTSGVLKWYLVLLGGDKANSCLGSYFEAHRGFLTKKMSLSPEDGTNRCFRWRNAESAHWHDELTPVILGRSSEESEHALCPWQLQLLLESRLLEVSLEYGYIQYLQPMNKDTGSQKGWVTCPGSHSKDKQGEVRPGLGHTATKREVWMPLVWK